MRKLSRKMAWLILAAAMGPFFASGGVAAEFSDEAVEKSIEKGVNFLWSKQKADGSWPMIKANHEYPVGPTALATYALLESGTNIQDPRMVKALEWLTKNDTDKIYSLGLRCNVWLAAERQMPGRFFKYLQHDGARLLQSLYQGGYNYTLGDQYAHNSTAQYGVLGVWAYQQGRGEVPASYWKSAMDYWLKGQQADGGWGYQVTFIPKKGGFDRPTTHAAMVPAGVASLFLCFDNLQADKFLDCKGGELPKPIQRGLDWFDKNFMKSLTDPKFPIGWQNMYCYYLYGVERVGLAAGYKYFGKVSWYKEGAKFLLGRQDGDGGFQGGFDRIPETAFALLFLIRGRHPVIFNKLEYSGDWNNRPRDLAFLTGWMSRTFERSLNWQIVNLQVDVDEWHDAPILRISGSKKPELSDKDLQKLRQYVLQGGTIFSTTECSGKPFAQGIREVYRKLFPEYELTPVGKEHPLYSDKVYTDLSETCRLEVVSNGVRPLIIHTDVDLPKFWQSGAAMTSKYAFQAATNVFMYVTDKGKVPHRGTTHWPAPVGDKGLRTVTLARIRHNGNDNPEPMAYERFARLMAQRCRVNVKVVGPIPANELAKSGAKLAVLSGVSEFKLDAAQRKALKDFVAAGGTLLVETAGGIKYADSSALPKATGFAAAAERLLEELYGTGSLRRLALVSSIYKLKGNEIGKVNYRGLTHARIPTREPNLRAVLVADRPAVLYSTEDLTHALLGTPCFGIDGYEPESAFAILRNILLSAAPE